MKLANDYHSRSIVIYGKDPTKRRQSVGNTLNEEIRCLTLVNDQTNSGKFVEQGYSPGNRLIVHYYYVMN